VKEIAVIFARRDSVYKWLAGCDVYDIDRDARTFPGGMPVVAHPPCRAWASLRHCAKPMPGERDLALWAIEQVREWGGVLEHPLNSTLWRVAGLPDPGGRDAFGGWTLIVDQHWWGHRARKRTRLYIVGIGPNRVPKMPMRLGEATHTVGLWSGRNRATARPSISKPEYEATPPALAAWLVELARRCNPIAAPGRHEASRAVRDADAGRKPTSPDVRSSLSNCAVVPDHRGGGAHFAGGAQPHPPLTHGVR